MSDTATRIDRWLWAVRMYKPRSAASDACKGGHVEINGAPAKPATMVKLGDRVTARVGDRVRELEVVKIIQKRVGAPIAQECYVDHTPEPEPRDDPAPQFTRERGMGRPTKRDRRELERLRGRN